MKKKVLFTVFLILLVFNTALVSAESIDNQPYLDQIYKKVLNGETIDNKNITAKYIGNEGNIHDIVEITVKRESKTISGVQINSYTTTKIGTISETDYDDAYVAKVTAGYNYDERIFNGLSARKITSFFITPVRLDNSFRFTRLKSYATQSGTGFTSSGSPTYVDETIHKNKYYPSSGYRYLYSTGFSKYVNRNYAYGQGMVSELTIERNSTGKTYTFKMPVGDVSLP